MTQATWEKNSTPNAQTRLNSGERLKYIVGGVLMLAAVAYLIVSGTMSGARYFMTIDELLADPDNVGRSVRISGAVVGESIVYDSANLIIDFTVANVPSETTDLALALHQAVTDPNAARISVHIEGEVKPDLLTNEAQAIMSGTLGEDGVFYATELLLKCPSRYEESVPNQAEEAAATGA